MREKRSIFISLLFLSICWIYIWGFCASPFQVSCFSYAGWGDHLQHYLGWISYVKDKNLEPFSRSFSGWTWPVSSEILYADTIPILSIILKPLFKFIRADFQYFSLASFANIIATFYCGLLIGKYFKLRISLSSLLGILLALSPIALIRITGHESLSLHFLIVYPITLLILRSVNKWKWNLLIFISLGTHAYFFPIILLLKVSSFCYQSRNNMLFNTKAIVLALKDIFFTFLSIILGLYSFGYLGNSFISTKNDQLWSANILALIDPQDYSLIFDRLAIIRPYQWEGYSYLGLLFFILLIFSIVLKITKNNYEVNIFPERSFYFVILCLFFIIALGSPIYLGENLLINKSFLMYDGSFIHTFRSTGRFMWPIYYSLIIWSYITIAKKINFNNLFTKIFIILILALMTENHFFVLGSIRSEMNSHYLSGIKFQKDINNNKISKLLKDNQYFINATGRPFYLSPSIPPLMPQAVNPNIKTNYYPRLARDNNDFMSLFSSDSCQILSKIFDEADQDIILNTLVLIDNDYIEKCNSYNFELKLELPNENVSIFSISKE